MDDAQAWVLIGGFLAILTAMVTLTLRTVRAEIRATTSDLGARIDAVAAAGVGAETRLGARIDAVEVRLGARIDGVETGLGARIDGVETGLGARIDTLGRAVDGLDRDVRLLFDRVFGTDAPPDAGGP